MAESTKPKPEQTSNASYVVGYGRPPRQHQFKVGNTASRRGRKRGSRNRTLVIKEILFEPIKVREGEEIKRMSLIEAIVRQSCNKALKGDHKAALMIIGLAQKEGLL